MRTKAVKGCFTCYKAVKSSGYRARITIGVHLFFKQIKRVANVIADNIWAQVNPDEQRYVIFESIIDHDIDTSIEVTKENMYCFVNGQRTMQKQQQVSSFLCLLKDGNEQWFPLEDLKESNPVECAEYAKARKINAPAFRWWGR